jgi:UDP:flavonoid glycosyltransferase YjiC (YdhE family)
MVIGSRGDNQPFLKIGKILKEKYGHRVRIAIHPAFKTFVENDIGLESFSVGGNPISRPNLCLISAVLHA